MNQINDKPLVIDKETLYEDDGFNRAKFNRFIELRSEIGCEVVLRSELLPVMEVAAMLRKSKNAVEKLVEEGKLNMEGGLITGESLVNFLDRLDKLIDEL